MGLETVYFMDIDTRPAQRQSFQYFPKEIEQHRTVDFVKVKPVGKSLPSYHGTGGELTMDFEISFTAETEDRADLMAKYKWLEARTYFNVNKTPVHRLQVVFGDMLNVQLWIITDLKANFSIFNLQRGNMPQLAIVKVSLALWAEATYTAEDVMGSFRTPIIVNTPTEPATAVDLSNVAINQQAKGEVKGYTPADLSNVKINQDARNRLEASQPPSKLADILLAYRAIRLGRAIL